MSNPRPELMGLRIEPLQLLRKIAAEFDSEDYTNLVGGEKQIADLLVKYGYLTKGFNGEMKKV